MTGWINDQQNAAGDEGPGIQVDGPVCFVEGTLILTPDGEVPVERLCAGDRVVTPRGTAPFAPVESVGSLHIDLLRQRDRTRAAPIVLRAGALAEGIPFRDLHLSPDHGLLIGGALVAARLLVNGITVVQQTWLRDVTYHQIELARHDVVVSDGALTETCLDDGNRHLFGHSGVTAIGPIPERGRPVGACAPFMEEGDPVLLGVRRGIWARLRYLQDRRNRA